MQLEVQYPIPVPFIDFSGEFFTRTNDFAVLDPRRSLRPHNFTEEFIFEPRLEPGLSPATLAELNAANIQFIHADWGVSPVVIPGRRCLPVSPFAGRTLAITIHVRIESGGNRNLIGKFTELFTFTGFNQAAVLLIQFIGSLDRFTKECELRICGSIGAERNQLGNEVVKDCHERRTGLLGILFETAFSPSRERIVFFGVVESFFV
jgi:hypothetical protein